MGSIICKPREIVCALKNLIGILDEKNLKSRKVPEELVNEVQNLKSFLTSLLQVIQEKKPNDYADLLKLLDKVDADKRFFGYLPFKGSLLESLSVLALKSRQKAVLYYLNKSIERTGRIEDKLFDKVEERYYKELLESVALFYALRTVGSKLGINPLKGIRANIGTRSVEEYFSDIIAGWIYEDWVISQIESCLHEGYKVIKDAVDSDRKIKFASIGGEADVEIVCNETKSVRLEVQRVGDRSCIIENGKLLVELKPHKISHNDFIILVFPPAFSKLDSLVGKILTIPTKEVDNYWYRVDTNEVQKLKHKILSSSLRKNTQKALERLLDEIMSKEFLSYKEREKFVSKFMNKKLDKLDSEEKIKESVESLFKVVQSNNFKFVRRREKTYLEINVENTKDKVIKAFDETNIRQLLDS